MTTEAGKRHIEEFTLALVARPNAGGMTWNECAARAEAAAAAIEAEAVAAERKRIDRLLLDEWIEPEDESMIGWNLAIKRARAIVGGDP